MKINEGKASCTKPAVFVYMRNVGNSNGTRALEHWADLGQGKSCEDPESGSG